MDKYYRGLIWTNHALERIGQRGLTQELVNTAFQRPDKSSTGKKEGTTEYQKVFGKSVVTVIAKKNDRGEWVILSCWVDPPIAGSPEAKQKMEYKKYLKSGFWGKILYTLKKQLGL